MRLPIIQREFPHELTYPTMKTGKLLIALGLALTVQQSVAQVRKILIEEFTASWCGWCPFGALELDSLEIKNPGKIIPVAIHDGDKYVIPEELKIIQELKCTMLPSMSMDRHFWVKGPNVWDSTSNMYLLCESGPSYIDLQSYAAKRLAIKPSCSVGLSNISYDAITKQVSVTVNTTFTRADSGDIRFNLYLTEDSIQVLNEQVNDANMYPGPFYMKGNPFAKWYHNHVIRSMQGGAWGTSGAIPAKVSTSNSYSTNYTFKISSSYNLKYLNLIGVVQKYDSVYTRREILNCEITRLSKALATGVIPEEQQTNISIYPNPTKGNCTIDILLPRDAKTSIDVINTLGEKVGNIVNTILSAGSNRIDWTSDLPTGIYFIRTNIDGMQTESKLIMSK